MKICLINNLYKPFNRGGAEKVAETVAAGLIKAGHEVFVITTKPGNKYPTADSQQPIYYLNGLYYNLNRLPKFFRFFWQIWNLFNFVNYFKIKKILSNEKCGAVITNNLMGVGFLTPAAIRQAGARHLHVAHDVQLIHPSGLMYYGEEGAVNSFFARIYAGLGRWLFKSPAVVIFPSRWLKDFYLKRGFFSQSKIDVLANPVDIAPRPAGKPKSNFHPVKFLYLGQMEKHKGVFLLIDAFNKIKEKYPEVELLIAGDGSQLESARRQAQGDDKIEFLGWPGDVEADRLLYEADCLVYPSLVYENCPNAIQRALAAGLPVLGSDLGGIPELLNKNAGLLFKPADVNDLAEKMESLAGNRENLSALAEAGRLKAATFKVKNYISELEKIISL